MMITCRQARNNLLWAASQSLALTRRWLKQRCFVYFVCCRSSFRQEPCFIQAGRKKVLAFGLHFFLFLMSKMRGMNSWFLLRPPQGKMASGSWLLYSRAWKQAALLWLFLNRASKLEPPQCSMHTSQWQDFLQLVLQQCLPVPALPPQLFWLEHPVLSSSRLWSSHSAGKSEINVVALYETQTDN